MIILENAKPKITLSDILDMLYTGGTYIALYGYTDFTYEPIAVDLKKSDIRDLYKYLLNVPVLNIDASDKYCMDIFLDWDVDRSGV